MVKMAGRYYSMRKINDYLARDSGFTSDASSSTSNSASSSSTTRRHSKSSLQAEVCEMIHVAFILLSIKNGHVGGTPTSSSSTIRRRSSSASLPPKDYKMSDASRILMSMKNSDDETRPIRANPASARKSTSPTNRARKSRSHPRKKQISNPRLALNPPRPAHSSTSPQATNQTPQPPQSIPHFKPPQRPNLSLQPPGPPQPPNPSQEGYLTTVRVLTAAILDTANGRRPISSIYGWMSSHFTKYPSQMEDPTEYRRWTNTARHYLTTSKAFFNDRRLAGEKRMGKRDTGNGGVWIMTDHEEAWPLVEYAELFILPAIKVGLDPDDA